MNNDNFTIQEQIAYNMLPDEELARLKQYKEELEEDFEITLEIKIEDKENEAALEIEKLEELLAIADKLNDELRDKLEITDFNFDAQNEELNAEIERLNNLLLEKKK